MVHCKGLGRAGTVAAMLLLQSGEAKRASDAIHMVRHARPGAIETIAQEEFLEYWAQSLHGRSLTTQVRSQELKDELPVDPELEGFLGLDPEIDGVSIVDLREGSGHIKIRCLES